MYPFRVPSFILIRKTWQSAPGPFKKSNHNSLLISATVVAFRGHGFSLLVTAKTCALALLVAKILALDQHSIFPAASTHGFPQKSPPALQSTNIDIMATTIIGCFYL